MHRILFLVLAMVLLLAVGGQGMAATPYVYTDLGGLPVESQTFAGVTGNVTETLAQSAAYGISATGHVVGGANITASNISAGNPAGASVTFEREFTYFGGQTDSFGTYMNGNNSVGYGINSAGQIAGAVDTAGSSTFNGVFYNNGIFSGIDSPVTDGQGQANAINEAGNVTGWVNVEIQITINSVAIVQKTIFWSGGSPVVLSDLDPAHLRFVGSSGQAINSSGQVAGWSYVEGSGIGTVHGCIMQPGQSAIDLGTLAGPSNQSADSYAYGIDNAGDVCGYSTDLSGSFNHAFLYTGGANGTMADLGVLPGGYNSFAYGMNNSGNIVGEADENGGGANAAFIWTASGGMQDLNTLTTGAGNWFMEAAYAVNDSGQIVGTAVNSITGTVHGFLLTPTSEATPPSVSVAPANFQAQAGQNITIVSSITGSSPLSFQWYNNGTAIAGATSANLSLTDAQASSSGNYSVTGTNLVGRVSTNVTLTVSQPAPAITTQPANATVSVGDTAQFSVVAAGSPTPTYQWQVLPGGTSTWIGLTDNATYAGSSTSTLSVNATAALNGAQFECVAANGISPNATSQAALLTVYPAGYVEWAGGLNLTGSSLLPTATPFGDTLPNLARFAMNIGAVPSAGQLPVLAGQVVNGVANLTLTYGVSKRLTGLQVVAQYSYDLQNWQALPNSSITQLADLNAQTAQYQASIAIPASGSVFLRLLVQSP